MVQWLLFFILTVLLLIFTLRRPHRHRFTRFFAFESLLALVILNAKDWFRDPLVLRQLISWLFLAASLFLALAGFRYLRAAGAPKGDIENTTQLVTSGPYRWIRHPLYCSLLLMGVGAFLKDPSLVGGSLFLLLALFVYATGRVEERDNLARFGRVYREYMARTKMFVPYVI